MRNNPLKSKSKNNNFINLVFADNILTKFIANDNRKVIKIISHLFLIYQSSLRKLKLKYFLKYRYKVIRRRLRQLANNNQNQYKEQFQPIYNQIPIRKGDIYEKLYHEYRDLTFRKDELNQRYDEEEAKKYPFSPRINYNFIIDYPKKKYYSSVSLSNKEKLNEINDYNNNYNQKNYPYEYHNRNGFSLDYTESFKSNSLMNKKTDYSSIELKSKKKNKNKFNTINKSSTPNTYIVKLTKERINTTREKPIYIKSNNFSFRKTNPSSLTIYNRSNNNNRRTDKPNIIKRKISTNNNNLLINLSDYNSMNSFSNPNIDNLSVLFSSRLHREKIDYQNNKKGKNTILNLHKRSQRSNMENSSSTNICDKGTNYISEKQSEQFSNLNLFENLQNKKVNQKNNKNQNPRQYFYTFRKGKIPYNTLYPSKTNIPPSISSKSTNFLSPRYDSQNTHDRNSLRSQRISNSQNINNNIDLDFSGEESYKKLSTQNSKSKNYDDNERKLNLSRNLEISQHVVNEYVINNINLNNNISRKSSHVSLQSISDAKLFELANYYVTSDESFDKFMSMRGKNRKINRPKSYSIK